MFICLSLNHSDSVTVSMKYMNFTPDFSEFKGAKIYMLLIAANSFQCDTLGVAIRDFMQLCEYFILSVFLSGLKSHKDTYLLGNMKLSRV